MKKVNLFLMVLLTVVFLSSLIISSHHAKAAPEEPIKLTLASWSPPMQVINRGGIDPWIKEIEKRTGGKVKITNFPGASLGKPPDHYDLAVKKLAEDEGIDAVVTIGCVIQGATRHDEIVIQHASRKIADLALEHRKPVTLGISGPGMSRLDAHERVEYAKRAVEAAVKMIRMLKE